MGSLEKYGGVFSSGDSLAEIAYKTLDTAKLKELTFSYGVAWLLFYAISLLILKGGLNFRGKRVLSMIASIFPYDSLPSIVINLLRVVILFATYLLWAIFLVVYGVEAMALIPIHVGMSILAIGFMLCIGLFAFLKLHADSFRLTGITKWAGVFVFTVWLAWELGVVYTVEPFSYIGLSAVMLSLNMLLTIAIVYLSQVSPRVNLDTFGIADFNRKTDLVRPKRMRIMVGILYFIALLCLGLYGYMVDQLSSVEAERKVGYISVGAIILLDLCILFAINSNQRPPPAGISIVVILSRLAIVGWGPDYWYLGHATLFFIVGTALGLSAVLELQDPTEPSLDLLNDKSVVDVLRQDDGKQRSVGSLQASQSDIMELSHSEQQEEEEVESDTDRAYEISDMNEGLALQCACCKKCLFGSSLRMLVFISTVYIIEMISLATYAKDLQLQQVHFTESGENYEQWSVAIGSLLLTIILPMAFLTWRLFIFAGKRVTWKVFLSGLITEVVTVGSGVYFWRISGVYILFTTSIFLPGIVLTFVIILKRWLDNDFFFLPKDKWNNYGSALEERKLEAQRQKRRAARNEKAAAEAAALKKAKKAKAPPPPPEKTAKKPAPEESTLDDDPVDESVESEDQSYDEEEEQQETEEYMSNDDTYNDDVAALPRPIPTEALVKSQLYQCGYPSSTYESYDEEEEQQETEEYMSDDDTYNDDLAALPRPIPTEALVKSQLYQCGYPSSTYEIIIGTALYFLFVVVYAIVVSNTSTPSYGGLILGYSLTVPVLTFLPLYKYFSTSRVMTTWIAGTLLLSILESVGFSLTMWYFVYDGTFGTRGMGLLFIIAIHIVVICFYCSYKFRQVDVEGGELNRSNRTDVAQNPIDDDVNQPKYSRPWIPGLRTLPPNSKFALWLVIFGLLVLAAFVATVIYFFSPRSVGVGMAAVYLVMVYIGYVGYVYQFYEGFLPIGLRVSSVFLVGVLVAGGIFVGYSENALYGFSFSWGVLFTVLSLYAISQLEYFTHKTLLFSKYIFPVYSYDARNEKLQEDSGGTAAFMLALWMAWAWGVVATMYVYPVYTGVTVSMVAVDLLAILVLEATFQQRVKFGQALVDCKSKAIISQQIDVAILQVTVRRPPPAHMSEEDVGVRIAYFKQRLIDEEWAEYEAQTGEDMTALWQFDKLTNHFWEDNQRMKALCYYLVRAVADNNRKQEEDLVRLMFDDLGFKDVSHARIKEWISEHPEQFENMMEEYLAENARLLAEEKKRAKEDEKVAKQRKKVGKKKMARAKRKKKASSNDDDDDDEPSVSDGWETPSGLYSVSSEDEWTDLDDYERSLALYRKSYAQAKERYERTGEKFTDKDFAPTMRAIYLNDHSKLYKKRIRKQKAKTYAGWKRPEQLKIKSPEEGRSIELFQAIGSGDVIQGALGNCWFISSMSVLGCKPELVKAAFVPGTVVNPYGIYGVTFYKDGQKEIIIVDDHIPVGGLNTPLFARPGDPYELWPMLMEKAYAKLHGSYEALIAGRVADGLADLTGGIPQMIRTQLGAQASMVASGALFAKMLEYYHNGYLLGAGSPSGSTDTKTIKGIHQTHQYSILRVVQLKEYDPKTGKPIQLVQMRNPWGKGEWTGAWSDHDKVNWTRKRRSLLGQADKNDGVFWMSFPDFVIMFPFLFVCKLFDGNWHIQKREAWWNTPEVASSIVRTPTYNRLFNAGAGYFEHETMEVYHLEVYRPTRVVTLLIQEDVRVGATTLDFEQSARSVRCDVWSKSAIGGKLLNIAYSGKAAAARAENEFTIDTQVLCEMYLHPGKYIVCCRAAGDLAAWEERHKLTLKVYSTFSVKLTPGPTELSDD